MGYCLWNGSLASAMSNCVVRFSTFIRAIALCLAVAVVSQQASAQLTVDKLWIDFDSNSSGREDVLLRNESDRRYYISVEPAEIMNPGMPDEARIEHQNPEDLGLLISPNRLILEPGEFRALRIVSINDEPVRDRVYRIRVTPKIGTISAEEGAEEDRNANLVVLMAYDLLVIVRPPQGKADVHAQRTGEKIVLSNTGNTNTLLIDGTACPPEGQDWDCVTLPDTRLYAGAKAEFDLPQPDAVVRFISRDRTYVAPNEVVY